MEIKKEQPTPAELNEKQLEAVSGGAETEETDCPDPENISTDQTDLNVATVPYVGILRKKVERYE